MISFQEALRLCTTNVPAATVEQVGLREAPRRVLAVSVRADSDFPPFDRVLMDGFAMRSVDVSRGWTRFRVIGEAAPGVPSSTPVGPGEAVRVATGAPLPPGTDTVVMLEHTRRLADVEFCLELAPPPGANVARQGAEHRAGEVLVEAGTVLTPLHLAVLVAAGCERIFVYRRPLLGVITTGSELVGVDQPREDYQVRDTNSIMLTRLLLELGLDPPFVATSGDDVARLCEAIERAKRCDILVLTGGVSVGHVDLVPTALEACGFEKVFHRVAIRPGKPTLLARNGQHLAFGLPGNPVSAAVGYFLFVRPTILRWVGVQDTGSLTVTAFLSEAVRQEKGRQGFHPGKLSAAETQLAVRPLPFSGSADLASFSSADCLIVLPQDVEELPCRVPVDVLPLTRGVANGIFSF